MAAPARTARSIVLSTRVMVSRECFVELSGVCVCVAVAKGGSVAKDLFWVCKGAVMEKNGVAGRKFEIDGPIRTGFPSRPLERASLNPVGEEDEAGYTAVESAVVSGAKKAVSKGGSKAKAGRDWPDGKIG